MTLFDVEIISVPAPREDLPEGWVSAPLGELGDWCSGGTPSKSVEAYWKAGTIPWVSPKDMKVEVIRDSIDHVTLRAVDESRLKLLPERTLLFVVRGMILAHSFPVAMTAAPVVINQDMRALTPHESVHPPYLLRALQHSENAVLHAVKEATHGTLRVESDMLKEWPIPLPPLAEQKRIAAKVEAVLAKVNAARQRLAKVPAILKRFRQSVLTAACSGRLTEDWREARQIDESCSSMLTRLKSARAEGRSRIISTGNEDAREAELLAHLPTSWIWTSIGDCFEVCVGGTPSRKEPRYWNGSIAWVSSGEVDFCRITKTAETISDLGLKNSNTKLHPPGTVLIGMIGEGRTRGQAAILDIPACTNQNAAAIRVSLSPIPPEFVYFWLASQYETTRGQGAGNSQPALNKQRVERIPFPLPPLLEQHEIVRRVSALFALADKVEARLAAAIAAVERVTQAVLAKAFRGELVETEASLARREGRDYEPAAKLLERIKADGTRPLRLNPKRRRAKAID